MEKLDMIIPNAWLSGFDLRVSLSISQPAVLEAIADAFEHAYRDRGTDEQSEEYISRKAEEYIVKIFSDVVRDQVSANASIQIGEAIRKNSVIRQRKDLPDQVSESEQ
jgi:hypothetical protein